MPNSLAIPDWFVFFFANPLVTICLFMAAIVLLFRTLVNMENEKIFNRAVGKRIRQLMDETDGLSVRKVGDDLQKDYNLRKLYPDDIQRRIKNPNIFFVLWLSNKYDLNEDFIFYGGNHKHTKVHRPKVLPLLSPQ